MKLLHIDSSITGDQSVSRQLSARTVEGLRRASPEIATTYSDLAKEPLPHHALPHAAERDRADALAGRSETVAA